MPARLRGARWTAWTPVLAAAAFLALTPTLGLVSPRSRNAAVPPSASNEPSLHEPPPPPLVAPRPPERVALAARADPAGESAPAAAGAGSGTGVPLPAPPEPGARLEVRVSAAGRGVSAWVELVHEPDGGPARVRVERADADGRVLLALEPGSVRAAAWSEDATALPARAALVAGTDAHVELALEPAQPVEGRVLDAQSGAPIAGAEVSFWTFAENDRVRTDAAGRFRHPRFPARAPAQQIAVSAAGHGRSVRYLRIQDGGWKLSAASEGEASLRGTGTPWLELELVPETRVRGRAVDVAGVPVAGARVAAEGFFHALPSVAARDALETTSAADGAFELAGLRSDIGHALVLESPGHAALVRELPPQAGELDLGSLVLVPETMLAGAVVDERGWPLADVELVLRVEGCEPAASTTALDVPVRIEARERRTRSDEHGAFVFEHLAARPVALEARAADGASWSGTLAPAADHAFAPAFIQLAPRLAQRPR